MPYVVYEKDTVFHIWLEDGIDTSKDKHILTCKTLDEAKELSRQMGNEEIIRAIDDALNSKGER
jgi:hypothetical protein